MYCRHTITCSFCSQFRDAFNDKIDQSFNSRGHVSNGWIVCAKKSHFFEHANSRVAFHININIENRFKSSYDITHLATILAPAIQEVRGLHNLTVNKALQLEDIL